MELINIVSSVSDWNDIDENNYKIHENIVIFNYRYSLLNRPILKHFLIMSENELTLFTSPIYGEHFFSPVPYSNIYLLH